MTSSNHHDGPVRFRLELPVGVREPGSASLHLYDVSLRDDAAGDGIDPLLALHDLAHALHRHHVTSVADDRARDRVAQSVVADRALPSRLSMTTKCDKTRRGD